MFGEAMLMSSAAETPRPDGAERLGRLFDAHHDRLYRLARRMSGSADAARDAVQDTFLRAARAPHLVPDGMPHEEAWLVRVLVNVCRDEWRRRDVRRRAAFELAPACERSAESALIARTAIQQALQALPPRRRAILVMYELEGAAIPAIAALLGIRAVTVRWHLSVGRSELARLIGRNHD
ncbi:MAG TPA: RNA polymerase sigma factor [Vicinamibacterales bacterium]|nr:RNA polymerase sigma factor [Vicinamibacterales bacterium]